MYPDPQNLDLIKKLLHKRGFSDIGSYKEKYLIRRLTIRMKKKECKSFGEYYDTLTKNKNEFALLKKTLSINVTEFFRDLDTWEEIQRMLTQYVKKVSKSNLAPSIRIWSAGCAIGPEPYSIGCIIHYILAKKLLKYDIKIYATDFNEELLQIAKKGIYEGSVLENVPREFLLKYFEHSKDEYRVKYNIKRMIEFSYLDLLKDKFSFPKCDMIFCRNVLIYFSKEIQKEIFKKFYDLIVPEGFLILGRTEILPHSFRDSFDVFSLKHRIYQKKQDSKPHQDISKKVKQKRNLKCLECGEKFDRLVDLRLHERKATCSLYRCKFCNKTFDNEIRYRAHLKYFH